MVDQGLQPGTLQAIVDELVTLTPASCQDPKYCDWNNILRRVLACGHSLAIHSLAIHTLPFVNDGQCCSIHRTGDLFVSFLIESDEPEIEVMVQVARCIVDVYTVRPNQFQLGVLHGHIFPLISLPYNEIKLVFNKPVKDVHAVYALINNEERWPMAHREAQTFALDKPIKHYCGFSINPAFGLKHETSYPLVKAYPSVHRVLCYGKQAFDRLDQPLYPIHLPEHLAALEIDWSTVKARLNEYREELAQVTWHPNRFMDWCLSVQD